MKDETIKNGVIVFINPFLNQQKIEVFKENEWKETLYCHIDDIIKTCRKQFEKYNINNNTIYVHGKEGNGFIKGLLKDSNDTTIIYV